MRRLSVLIILTLISSVPVAAENETAKLLGAVHVKSGLNFQVDDSKLEYQVDGMGNFIGFESDEKKIDTFTANRQIDLVFVRFNPLTYTIQTKEDLRDDATAAAVADFLKKLVETASGTGLIPPINAQTAGQAEDFFAMTGPTFDALLRDIDGEITEAKAAEKVDPCARYEALHDTLTKLDALMSGQMLTADEVDAWENDATGRQGVVDVRTSIDEKVRAIDRTSERITELVGKIEKEFVAENGSSEARCGKIRASTFALLFDVSHRAADIHAKNLALRKDLVDLHKALEIYTKESRWIGDSFIFLKPRINPEKIATINVKVTPRTLNLEAGKLKLTEGSAVETKFDLRQYHSVIAEVIPALIYTDLAYPKWGTDEKDGVIKVKKGKDSRFPMEGAVTLNMLWSRLGTSMAYPTFQLGISSAKDFPGFLGGVGLRFVGKYPVSISVGRMITWYKDLDKLAEGSVVTGTADIEADLKFKRSPVAWYAAIQYKF